MDLALVSVYAAAVVSAWELVAHLPEELEYIWVTPQFRNDRTVKARDISPMKVLYVYSRYYIFVILYQYFINEVAPSKQSELSEGYITYKSCIFQILVWSVDLPLMKIVHLLFGGMRKALYLLVALALIKLGLDLFIVWTYHAERLKGYRMSPSGEAPRNAILIFAIGEISVHAVIVILLFIGNRRAKYLPTPATTRLIRHTTPTLGVGALLLGLVIATNMATPTVTQCIYPFLSTGFAVLACRLILIMHTSYYSKKRTTFDLLDSDLLDESDNDWDDVRKE